MPARIESITEQAIKKWLTANHGALSRIAREYDVSAAHVHYIMFNQRKSKDLRIERALKALGCPLMQRLG